MLKGKVVRPTTLQRLYIIRFYLPSINPDKSLSVRYLNPYISSKLLIVPDGMAARMI